MPRLTMAGGKPAETPRGVADIRYELAAQAGHYIDHSFISEADAMEKDLLKYMGRQVELMYIDKQGQISKRKLLLQSMENGRVHAFDYNKLAPRIFLIENILAVLPVHK